MPGWLVLAFLIVSLAGFADASYLTSKHYQHETPTCSVIEGCEEVTTSKYSTVLGVPVALGGAVYYLMLFLGTMRYYEKRNDFFAQVVPYFTVLGLLASIWFVYLQLAVIKAICLYCMGSAISSTLLFILGLFVIYYRRK